MGTDINRLKVVLAEKKRTNKWLCEQLNVGKVVGKHIKVLEVNVDDLLNTQVIDL